MNLFVGRTTAFHFRLPITVLILQSLCWSICWCQQLDPLPGTYWKCPGDFRTDALRRPSFTASVQARYSLTQKSADQPTWLLRDDRSTTDGYNTRRIRLSCSGQPGEDLLYFVQVRRDWGADEFELHDLYLTYSGWNFGNLTVGQMRTPFDRQFLMSDTKLPLAERSRTSAVLIPDRDIGLLFHGTKRAGSLGWYAGLYTGNGKNQLSSDGAFMSSARIEWLATTSLNMALNWAYNNSPRRSNFQKFLTKNGDPYNLQPLYRARQVDEEMWGVDLLFRREATSIWAGYTAKEVSGPGGNRTEADGWYIHLGQYVPWGDQKDKVEIVVGYEEFDPNKEVPDKLDFRQLTTGFNYHIDGYERQVRLQYVLRDEKRHDVKNNTLMIEYDHMLR